MTYVEEDVEDGVVKCLLRSCVVNCGLSFRYSLCTEEATEFESTIRVRGGRSYRTGEDALEWSDTALV